MAVDCAEMERFIGVKAVSEDVITASQVQRLNATLNRREPAPKEGDPVLWGWHSIFFPKLMPTDGLDPDGAAPDFENAPASPLPRRMYAGNDLKFYEPLRIGDRATKEVFIKSVVPKEGRSGALVFVIYGIRIIGPRGLVLEDDQNIVFREEEPAGTSAPPPPAQSSAQSAVLQAPWRRTVNVDPVMLFRFSACSFNPHRIHYDLPYVTGVEGYPDLIVHGPLTAVLLLELVRDNWKDKALDMSGFAMRAKAPLFANRPITLLGEPSADGKSCRLWAANEAGHLAMEISARFK